MADTSPYAELSPNARSIWPGDFIASKPGTTISSLDIQGNLIIAAADVTVVNCVIRGRTLTLEESRQEMARKRESDQRELERRWGVALEAALRERHKQPDSIRATCRALAPILVEVIPEPYYVLEKLEE